MPSGGIWVTEDELIALVRRLAPDPHDIAEAVISEMLNRGLLGDSNTGDEDDLTIEESIDFIGEGRTRIYERINAGQLVAYRRGRRTMITRASAVSTRQAVIEEGLRKIEAEQAARAAKSLRGGRNG